MRADADHGAGGTTRAARRRLGDAYRATLYRVQAPGDPIDIRIGRRNPRLDALLAARGARHWLWMTACNPGSKRLARSRNEHLARRLRAAFRGAGLRLLPATGMPVAGDWQPEPGVLVFDLDVADGLALARRHGQNAIVCGRRGGVACLRWL